MINHCTAGFLGAMIAGGVGGAAAGIGMRTTQTAISGDWSHWQGDIFNPAQVATDLAFGAVGGAVGYGVRQVFPTRPIINNRNEPYPEVNIQGYGKVPFPDQPYTPNNSSSRLKEFTSTFKRGFRTWWIENGYTWPKGEVNIHHIKPLQYGGGNTFENLVPLTRAQHDLFTNWWRHFR